MADGGMTAAFEWKILEHNGHIKNGIYPQTVYKQKKMTPFGKYHVEQFLYEMVFVLNVARIWL